ncbi:hypothetical protein BDV3_006584 [Batrachochytrium dendrobatidis]
MSNPVSHAYSIPLPVSSVGLRPYAHHNSAHVATLPLLQIIIRILQLSAIIIVWMFIIWKLALILPTTDHPIHIPHSLADLKLLAATLKVYSSSHFIYVLVLFCAVFLFKQSFGVPGSALLNVLAGALYGYPAIILISVLAAIGSTIGYLLSKHIIGTVIFGNLISRSRILSWRMAVDEHRDNMLPYMISIRTMPVVPGWFVNLASPFVGVPIGTFFTSTAIGLVPFHYICVQAAHTLSTLESMAGIFSIWTVLQLFMITAVIIVPVVFKKRLAKLYRKITSY